MICIIPCSSSIFSKLPHWGSLSGYTCTHTHQTSCSSWTTEVVDNKCYLFWQWRNFFISYLCQLFFCHFMGRAVWNVCYSRITFLVR